MSGYGRYPDSMFVDCTGDRGLTVQADRDEVDINKIVARFKKTGSLPEMRGDAFYGDVSEFDGLADAYMKIKAAEELFMQYPADLREKFGNDPVEMVEFLQNPANLESAVDMGLAVRRPTPVEVAPAAPPSPVPEQGK